MLAVHGDELAAYALQLGQRHGCGWELDGRLDVWDCDVASSFSLVIFLVGHDLREDVGRRLVEFVEVVLLGRGFLLLLEDIWGFTGRGTYQHCRHIRLHRLHLAIAADHGFPYLLTWRRGIFFDHDEQRTVPPRHAIGLLIPEDEVLEVFLVIPSIRVLVGQQLLVVFATSIGRRPYMQLLDCQSPMPCFEEAWVLTTQLGVCSALASQYSWYRKPLM